MLGNQRPSLAELTGGAGVTDRLIDMTGRLMPARGPPMQQRHEPGLAETKLQLQQLGEQLEVAVPRSPVVQRHQEQRGRLRGALPTPGGAWRRCWVWSARGMLTLRH